MTLLQSDLTYPATASACALVGSVFDVKSRRIPNFVTVPAFLLGLAMHLALGGWRQLLTSLAAGVICGLVFLVRSEEPAHSQFCYRSCLFAWIGDASRAWRMEAVTDFSGRGSDLRPGISRVLCRRRNGRWGCEVDHGSWMYRRTVARGVSACTDRPFRRSHGTRSSFGLRTPSTDDYECWRAGHAPFS